MPRVMHWIQQGSVAHYRTNMEEQLHLGPWSGFVQTHLWLLWGNDQLENMLQWSAMLGCLVTATLLVRQLLPDETAVQPRAQALLRCSLSRCQRALSIHYDANGLHFRLLMMCLASVGWHGRRSESRYAVVALRCLGALTKFTVMIYALPSGWPSRRCAWKQRRAIPKTLLTGVSALLIASR
jgi:hypothetical protein